MSEYIITDKQLGLIQDFANVCVEGEKLPRIVRCRDCVHYKPYRTYQHGIMNRCHDEQGHTHRRYESDFCSRGERRRRMKEYIVTQDWIKGDEVGEPIVRCRDCRYYDQNDDPSEVFPNSYWCDKLTVYMPPDGFCSFGKRKVVGE